jgi:glycerol-3-phosphate dehydrogenase
VINAAGPWVDRVFGRDLGAPRLIGGTKGSHLVIERFSGAPTDIVYHESQSDHRLVLVVPWHGRLLIGTTDSRFEDDPDDAMTDEAEMAYLLGESNRVIPSANLTPDSVAYTFSGVRPLPYAPDTAEGSLPRSHTIYDHGPSVDGLLSVIGGKLTTFRSLAQDAVDAAFLKLGRRSPPCTTDRLAFPGVPSGELGSFRTEFVVASGLPTAAAERLVGIYGSRAADVMALGRSSPELLAPLGDSEALGAELVFAVDHELARTLTAVLMRRLLVGLEPGHGLASTAGAADLLARHLGWDGARRQNEIDGYHRYLRRFAVPGRLPDRANAAAA